VERRQQIGVLRAIGFRRGMVQLSFLIESSFISLSSIVIGTALGLAIVATLFAATGYRTGFAAAAAIAVVAAAAVTRWSRPSRRRPTTPRP
jgi:ABC-type antimicrobial peptide transport system permease subunit